MAKEVFGVVSGEYSDYTVSYVCETIEIAEQVVERLNRIRDHDRAGRNFAPDEYRVETFPLIESPESIVFTTEYTVWVDGAGEVVGKALYVTHDIIEEEESVDGRRCHDGTFYGHSKRSAEVAIKAARDALAEYKAQQAGH